MSVGQDGRHVSPPQGLAAFWLPHVVLIGTVAVCLFANMLLLAPFILLIAALALRSRMLMFAGFGLVLLFLVFLLLAGGIGGSVDGGLVE